MSKLLRGAIVGGILLFTWSVVSWVVLNWHFDSIKALPDQDGAMAWIASSVQEPGVYLMPMNFSALSIDALTPEQLSAPLNSNSPAMFAAVAPSGSGMSVINAVLLALAAHVVAAFFVTAIILINTASGFWSRFSQVLLFAIAASVTIHVPHFIWFNFPLTYTLIAMIDSLIGWLFAGIVIAYITKPSYPNFR